MVWPSYECVGNERGFQVGQQPIYLNIVATIRAATFPYGDAVKRIGFRNRLLLILAIFALAPSIILTLVYGGAVIYWLPRVSANASWEQVAETGIAAMGVAERYPLSEEERSLLEEHRKELSQSLSNARRLAVLMERAPLLVAVLAFITLLPVTVVASRVAGHLSRQLSRPLQELVGWTEMISKSEPLPDVAKGRGAPEFDVLRKRMRRMARALTQARARALEAERLRAFRESARQVAHELKNPLTPIRFAVARLRRDAPVELAEAVEVLETETRRMEEIAKNFAQFGRLPEGPVADIDIAELLSYTARASVPEGIPLTVTVHDGLPPVRGHYNALSRAVTNAILNAVDACREGGTIEVSASRARSHPPAVEILVKDTGCGIATEKLAGIWDPYVTDKPGGTGLGLAIARQTIEAHKGMASAKSVEGDGTEIRFTLPAEEPVATFGRRSG